MLIAKSRWIRLLRLLILVYISQTQAPVKDSNIAGHFLFGTYLCLPLLVSHFYSHYLSHSTYVSYTHNNYFYLFSRGHLFAWRKFLKKASAKTMNALAGSNLCSSSSIFPGGTEPLGDSLDLISGSKRLARPSLPKPLAVLPPSCSPNGSFYVTSSSIQPPNVLSHVTSFPSSSRQFFLNLV